MKISSLLTASLALGFGVRADDLFSLQTSNVISNECCDLTYNDINTLNSKVRPLLAKLVTEDYFKHIQFKLEMDCPFFECQSICFSPGCQLDLDVHSQDYNYDLLENGEKLGDINEDSFLDSLCPRDNINKQNGNEWCDLNDKDGVIIDISRNPERFTGYIPTPEQNIWGMIYQHQLEGECPIEQKVFYQIISGFHSSVSTHLSNEWYNNETNNWEPNLKLFQFKVGDHPERIENIYFDYAIMVRSILKISKILDKEIKFNPLNHENNQNVHDEVMKIVNILPRDMTVFNEDIMFKDHEIKEDFKLKFKNVTKLMDCVTCDRCRLWGKVQSTGYATALKILFEDEFALTKSEISSLFNTFDRLTKSIESINNFNYLKVQEEEKVAKQKSIENEQLIQAQEVRYNDDEPTPLTNQNEEEDTSSIMDTNPLKNIENEDKNSFKSRFNEEMGEVWGALKFIWSSYVNLPNNVKNLFLYKFNQVWNKFIGIENYNNQEEYLHNIIV